MQLIRNLHGEVKYDGLDALMAGIARDCDDARQILAGTPYLA
ncbi:riboflavin kinase [Sphingobium rhizovicinum]|uniref:riboflavin kinase n=1 Tax=Sphingobium rhizovicinum TaxID=432308 RepID=A0ABV7NP26_9SPHN